MRLRSPRARASAGIALHLLWTSPRVERRPRSSGSDGQTVLTSLSVIQAPSLSPFPPKDGAGGVDIAGLVLPTMTAGSQARAMPWLDGLAAAIPATRMNAVTPTAIAPMTENTTCQVSDGMVCFTMPCVA